MASSVKKSEETRQRILEAALILFRHHGFANTTMRDIAKKAGVALGGAYYYFDSKDAIVMGFYERAQAQLRPLMKDVLSHSNGLEDCLRKAITAKFQYFAPNRKLMTALSAHIDPAHPLSPFSKQTAGIREDDISFFSDALANGRIRVPEDLKPYLPRVLWLYQMGLFLFWVYDSSKDQIRTHQLFERTLAIVVRLIKFSTLPLMRPVRKIATDLFDIVYGSEANAEVMS
jgi:AcrR family transcriptional regulator